MDLNQFLGSLEGDFREEERFQEFVKQMEGHSREDLLFGLYVMHKDMDQMEKRIKYLEDEVERVRNSTPLNQSDN